MNTVLRILILGGYGTFGGRLALLLCDEPRVSLLIAGRSREQAEQFCRQLPGNNERIALAFDRNADLAGLSSQLQTLRPDLVVDASGPFQAYGTDPYRVVEACLACGVSYLDLADGSDFVQGIARFHAEAQEKNLFVLSGVSSFPVLTAAVVRALSPGMKVKEVFGGIAPSPYAGVGLNVIRAIASYAGKPVTTRRGGRETTAHPLTESRLFVIAPPGLLPLHATLFSLVDVPDLQALPALWPDVDTVWMGAGPVPPILHAALRLFARLVRLRLIPTLSPLAPLMHWAVNVLAWGEHRGGMFVEVKGVDDAGLAVTRSWHLLAEGDDGPLIPSMAVAAIVQRCLQGKPPASGARAGVCDLELADYEAMFRQRTIYTGVRVPDKLLAPAPLYHRLLGSAWDTLPAPIREMHDLRGTMTAAGTAQIERGPGLLAALVATLFRFPRSGNDVPVQVRFDERAGREDWRRTFGDHGFTSVQYAGSHNYERLLCERFGPFTFGMGLVSADARLYLVIRKWTFCGLPLPLLLAPRGTSYETVIDGRFNFHVEISMPLVGLVVRYRGWLIPASKPV